MFKKNQVLIGIILDVSSSMRKNWKNAAGKRVPRLEVIKDVLNEHLWKLAVIRDEGAGEIQFFCLGMGLQRIVTFVGVDLRNKEEKLTSGEPLVLHESDLVCDLLALSQTIPTKSTLEEIKRSLDEKWRTYVENMLRDINGQISADAQQDLHSFIRQEIEQSARDALYRSWRYKLSTWLEHSPLRRHWSTLERLLTNLLEHTSNWEIKIQRACSNESNRYVEAVQFQIEQFFESKRPEYFNLIRKMLLEFASTQIQIILELLTAGHSTQRALEHFDESSAISIAKEIYGVLDGDVKKHLQIRLLKDLERFIRKMRLELRASIGRKTLRSLTRDYIQQYVRADSAGLTLFRQCIVDMNLAGTASASLT